MPLAVQCCIPSLLPGLLCSDYHPKNIQFLKMVPPTGSQFQLLVGGLAKFHYGEFVFQNAIRLRTARFLQQQCSLGYFRLIILGSLPSVQQCFRLILQILKFYWLLGALMEGELCIVVYFHLLLNFSRLQKVSFVNGYQSSQSLHLCVYF